MKNATMLYAATLAAALLGSSAAIAAEPVSTTALTRAEVRAELARAQAAGELVQPGESYAPDIRPVANARQRVDVRAEARTAAAAATQRPRNSRNDTGS